MKRRSFFLAAVAVAVCTAVPAVADDITYDKLFFIQRSKNANEVHYDARVQRDGALDPKEPMVGYWLNKAEDGSRSSITMMQKIAYGYSVEKTPKGAWALKLKAFKERDMWIVKANNGKWRVLTTISGKQAYMSRLYVATDESGVIPKVLYVDVFGEETANGKAVKEHIAKD